MTSNQITRDLGKLQLYNLKLLPKLSYSTVMQQYHYIVIMFQNNKLFEKLSNFFYQFAKQVSLRQQTNTDNYQSYNMIQYQHKSKKQTRFQRVPNSGQKKQKQFNCKGKVSMKKQRYYNSQQQLLTPHKNIRKYENNNQRKYYLALKVQYTVETGYNQRGCNKFLGMTIFYSSQIFALKIDGIQQSSSFITK
eukprot:TRINITY_DN14855_c0_g1_i1.p2 TRINITY_DN14855_c0_g1~~TRINITY_DN14855_c0_g1_i1.p2  ORF type:complete len:192 (-),score=-7.71 TRINITY_DN14855_c0_g1_i1:290-865(-)